MTGREKTLDCGGGGGNGGGDGGGGGVGVGGGSGVTGSGVTSLEQRTHWGGEE